MKKDDVIGIKNKMGRRRKWKIGYIVYVQQEEKGAKDGALGDSRTSMQRGRGAAIQDDTLRAIEKIRVEPINKMGRSTGGDKKI